MGVNTNKWGYSIDKSNLIDLDRSDTRLYNVILKHVPSLKACIFCGGCSATCTVQQDGMNFRHFHLLLARGEMGSLKNIVSPCLLCGKCTLLCPRNVDIRSIIYNFRLLSNEPI